MANADDGRTVSAIACLSGSLRREFAARMRDEGWAREVGMRPPAYGILQCVRAWGPISQRELSDVIGIDPGDIVSIVDVLELAGFVTRTRDADDGRRRNLTLTPEGGAATAQLDAIAAEVLEVVLAPLSKRERAVLERLLAKAAFTGVGPNAGGRPGA